MTSKKIDRLLERAVASALGVPLPQKRRIRRRIPVPALLPGHMPVSAGR